MITETTTWVSVTEKMPDADTTVHVFVPDGDEQVWLGYFDVDSWCYVDGPTIDHPVTHWANMLIGPARRPWTTT